MNFMFGGGSPFGDMGEGGPFGGMGGGGGGGGPVDNNEFYETLGVEKDATEAQIRKAYRKLAIKHHPDKGGDPEHFKTITQAYEVLSNSEKKEKYDKYGKEGLEREGGGDPGDIFSAMFGGGGRRRGPQKGEDHVHPLKVSLADLYKGRTVKLAITRNILCSDCEGRGGAEGARIACDECRGRGIKVQLRQVGPGMIQQSQSICPKCRGQKTTMRDEDKCRTCTGDRTVRDRKVLEVYIERGMKEGDKITFSGEADQAPDALPGDVVFVVDEKEHPTYTRKGPDLFIKKTLTLSEALTGFSFPVERLDGTTMNVASAPGQIIKPDALMAIDNEGMPVRGAGEHTRGVLFVQFDVEFPKPGELDGEQLRQLKSVLPPKPDVVYSDEMERVTLVEGHDPEEKTPWSAGGAEAYDSDDDEGRGGQRVQCASQ